MIELLVLAIAPALFIFWYIYKKDCYEPEPLHLVAWVFFLGALSVIPALILEYPFPEGIFTSAVVAPVAEELVKFSVVFLVMFRHPEFDEPMDGIVYAAAAGLGFATIENIFYVLEGGVAVGILRAVASVPGHVIFSCIWGYALGVAKFRPGLFSRAGIILAGLFGAMVLHGLFNFSLEYYEVWGLLLILVVIIPLGWWMTKRNIRLTHAHPASACSAWNQAFTGGTEVQQSGTPGILPDIPAGRTPAAHFCTGCGAPLKEGARYCDHCGKEA